MLMCVICPYGSVLGTICRRFICQYTIKCKQEKSQMAHSGWSALKLSAPRWWFWMCVIVFPALTLPRDSSVSYRCLGSFSISDKRLDLRYCQSVFSLWNFKSGSPSSQRRFGGTPISLAIFRCDIINGRTGGGVDGRGGALTVSTTLTRHTTQEGLRTTGSRHTSFHNSTPDDSRTRWRI